jgi:hypothetical protein
MRIVAEVARTWFRRRRQEELRTQQATVRRCNRHWIGAQPRRARRCIDRRCGRSRRAAGCGSMPCYRTLRRASAPRTRSWRAARRTPERELALLDAAAPHRSSLPALPVGERADILRRRPDVLAAERRLAASTADIGVATAELFPKLSIGAGGGFQALNPGDWFDRPARASPSCRSFPGGCSTAAACAPRYVPARPLERQAALAYEQAVLAHWGCRARAWATIAPASTLSPAASQRWMRLATQLQPRQCALCGRRHRAGRMARRRTAAARGRNLAVRARTAAAVQMVALYKALGGGWDVSTAATDRNPSASWRYRPPRVFKR